ncbi:MAG: 16S rRNA (cytidine(1402)-2'-O)-methyltransferase [Pseudomonadota bacterium]
MPNSVRGEIYQTVSLTSGLYLVATPIGTARDITLRALDILASADAIAAEDTRVARRLLELHAIPLGSRPLLAYHDHNGASQRPKLLAILEAGKSLAYVSDAGTPLVADPGFALVREVAEAGHKVTAAPGPSALLAALSLAGLPTDKFLFAGFAPSAKGARRRFLEELAQTKTTVVLFESAKRVHSTLDDLCDVFGEDCPVAICRELTKKFEEVMRGKMAELIENCRDRVLKGEIVLVIGQPIEQEVSAETLERALDAALQTQSVKEAAAQIASQFEKPRRQIYQLALAMKDRNE